MSLRNSYLFTSKVFDCRPAQIISYLGLLQPQGWSYEETASYGHFGRSQFPWEKVNKVECSSVFRFLCRLNQHSLARNRNEKSRNPECRFRTAASLYPVGYLICRRKKAAFMK